MEENDDNSDEELAPMVDGLSGTLCIIILVSMVFIFSGMKTAETHINYGQLKFEKIQIDIPNKRLYFKGGIHLSSNETSLIKQEIVKKKVIKLLSVVTSMIKSATVKKKTPTTFFIWHH